jgi:competence protein ComEC
MLLSSRLRWSGLPLVALGAGWALLAPRPDLLVSADGRQVAVVADGVLHTLRGHRGGFTISNWEEQAASGATARLSALPGARCTPAGCIVPLEGGRSLLALTEKAPLGPALLAACRRADIVSAPIALPATCAPRWRRLDLGHLRLSGAVAIHSTSLHLDSVAARAGDQPWSPAALPGTRPSLLGTPAWTGVIAE